MVAKADKRLDWPFIWVILGGFTVCILAAESTNLLCSAPTIIPTEVTSDCWSAETSNETTANQKPAYEAENSAATTGIPLPQIQQRKTTKHCTNYSSGQKKAESGVSICDTRITDWAIVFFTYCLAVVGYFTILADARKVQAIERPWLFIENVRTSKFLNPEQGAQPRVHVFVQNPGRSPVRDLELRGKIFTTTNLTQEAVDKISLTSAPLDQAYALTIPPNSTNIQTGIAIEPLSPPGIASVDAGDTILVARGVFTYRGPFGEKYETSYCVRYRRFENDWIGFGGAKYNYST